MYLSLSARRDSHFAEKPTSEKLDIGVGCRRHSEREEKVGTGEEDAANERCREV